MSEEEIERKIAVIFATDVVGYSKHMEADESSTIKNLRACEKILTALFEKHKGRLFNTGGDSFLAEFASAVSAIECAVEFQKAIKNRNSSDDTSVKLEFRIGINSGDVVKEKENLLGDGVNIAARLEALAQIGGITISKGVYDFVKGKTSHEFNDIGLQKVKQNEFHAYDVILNPNQKRKIKGKKFNNSKMLLGFAFVLIAAVAIGTFFLTPKFDTEKNVLFGDLSLAVLPFKNVSNKKNDEPFVNGLSNSIRTLVAKTKRFSVISQTSSKAFANSNNGLLEIADELNVDYLIEGDFQHIGDQISIDVSMVEAKTGEIVWDKNFKATFELSLGLQEEIALNIASHLTSKYGGFWAKLVEKETPDIGFGQSQNMDAHQLILAAWKEFYISFRTDTERRLLKAVDLGLRSLEMEEATETYGLLSFSYGRLAKLTNNRLYFEKSQEISELGLDFDPSGDLIYRALGYIEFDLRPHFEGVQLDKDLILKYYDRSIFHNPSDSNSYTWKALIYAKFGDGEQAVKSAQRAIELSPTMQGWECWPYALAYYSTRDFERMLEYSRQGQCKEYSALAAYQLDQKKLASEFYQQYVENYEQQHNKNFSFKHLENQEYFIAKEENLEFISQLKTVHDSWLTGKAS